MQLAAAVGCEKWKPPATNSEFKESVRLCNAAETLEKKVLLNTLFPPSHLLKKKEPRFLRSDVFFRFFLLEVFLGEPRLVAYAGINGTAAV